jgi:hypothetical protein
MATARRPEDYEQSEFDSRTGLREATLPVQPTGPAAAATMGAGFGAFMVGLMTVLAEASESLREGITLFDDVGPLSGKVIIAVAAWLAGWVALHLALRRRDFSMRTAMAVMLVLLGLGLLGTFPPFFELFAAE